MADCYYLAHHAFYCSIGAIGVLLDLRGDRYIRVKHDEFLKVLNAPALQTADKTPHDLQEKLLQRGLITSDCTQGAPMQTLKAPRPNGAILPRLSAPAPSLQEIGLLTYATLKHDLQAKFLPLEKRITALKRQAAGLPAVDDSDQPKIIDLLTHYRSVRHFFPGKRVCLRDSLTLYSYFAAHGLRVTLLFGVRLEPFGAHCWLQAPNAIINDDPVKCSSYEPIMMV